MSMILHPCDRTPEDAERRNQAQTQIALNNEKQTIDIDIEAMKDEFVLKDEMPNDFCIHFESGTDIEIKSDIDSLDLSMTFADEENAIDNENDAFALRVNDGIHCVNTQISSVCNEVTSHDNPPLRDLDSCREMDTLVKKYITGSKRVEIVQMNKVVDWGQYFVCETCLEIFVTRYLLTEHVKTHKILPSSVNKSLIVCETCEFNCPNVNERKKLTNAENDDIHYTCASPGIVTLTENDLVWFKCNFCEYFSKLKIAYVKHVSIHFSTDLLICKDCPFECVNESELQNHRMINHNVVFCVKLSCCDLCKLKFITKAELDSHRVSDHNVRIFTCKECSITFEKRTELIKHKLLLHNHDKKVDLFICDLCELKFAYKKDLHVHKLSFHKIKKPYQCETCSYQSREEKAMRKHRKEHAIGQEYKCEICPFNSKFENELKRHSVKQHGTIKIYSCDFDSCEYKARSRGRLRQHKLSLHSDIKGFNCDKCDYRCKVKANLRKHNVKHLGERPFKCVLCPNAFHNQYGLTKHIMKHTSEPPLRCTLCPFESTAVGAYSLKRHMLNIHNIGPNKDLIFSCVLCHYKCRALSVLKNHVLKHTGEKPLACDLCPFKTTRATNLRLHKMVHTGERPVECDLCDYKCRYRANMVKHMVVHTGMANYKCDICPKTFKRSEHMKKHRTTHV